MALLLGLMLGGAWQGAARGNPWSHQPVRMNVNDAPLWVMVWPRGSRVFPATGAWRSVPEWLRETGAVAAINGGFFNHSDGEPVSYVRQDGRLVDDPKGNRALMTNPELRSALPLILNARAAWFVGSEGWGIAPWGTISPDVQDALQAGPVLLPEPSLEKEAFRLRRRDGTWRDGIQSARRARRSAIGLRADGSMVWVVAGGPGLDIRQLAHAMKQLSCVQAMALDGGSSSTLAWRGPDERIHWGPDDTKATARVRSVLLVFLPGVR
ncbi:MAG: phosphodiester glycosidase family protein [Candidatus Sericytochromatia bacterium]|nr:phosphodiester glycosidase family protein [Candidatus Sericytochromatia bacterium]